MELFYPKQHVLAHRDFGAFRRWIADSDASLLGSFLLPTHSEAGMMYRDIATLRQEAELAAIKNEVLHLDGAMVLGILDALDAAEEETRGADADADDLAQKLESAGDHIAELEIEVEDLEAENRELVATVAGEA